MYLCSIFEGHHAIHHHREAVCGEQSPQSL